MTCPKCQSPSVFDAMGEAPIGVTAWKKCLACGKRWDPTTTAEVKAVVDTVKRAFEEWHPPAETVELGEDERDEVDLGSALEDDELEETPVASPAELAMRDVRIKRGVTAKEGRMGQWSEEARERHRERMKQIWADKRAGSGKNRKPKKFANAAPKQAVKAAAERATSLQGGDVPAVREPKTVVPRAVAGNTLSVIDAAIVQIREDVDALVRAREILARMQG